MFYRPRYRLPASTMVGLQGWWTFDDCGTINTPVLDYSGNNHIGILEGIDFSSPILTSGITKTGFKSGSMLFGATSPDCGSYNVGNLDFSSKIITITAWVYPTAVSGGTYYMIVTKRDAALAVNYEFYHLGGDLRWFLGTTEISSGTTLSVNKWQHVAVSFTGSTGAVKFYYNGFLVNSLNDADVVNVDASKVRIGDWGPRGGGSFVGKIDDVRIYNRVLAPAEILAIASELYLPAYEVETISLLPTVTPPTANIIGMSQVGAYFSNRVINIGY